MIRRNTIVKERSFLRVLEAEGKSTEEGAVGHLDHYGVRISVGISRASQLAVARFELGTSSHYFLLKIIGSAVRFQTRAKLFARSSRTKTARRRFVFCAASWNRTNDPLLKRQVLYRLSYSRISLVYNLIIQQIAMESIIPRNCQMTISS